MKNGILSELKIVFNLNEYNNYTIPAQGNAKLP